MKINAARRLICSLVLAALFGLTACESVPMTSSTGAQPAKTQAKISQELMANAQVVAVERAARVVTLRSEGGRYMAVHAGEAVRNFDQIDVGDNLRVRYRAVMVATLSPAESAQPAEAVAVAARAPKGATPAGAMGVAFQLTVKIESIDLTNDIVVFSLASGELIAHRIATTEGREFIRGLKIGNTVQLDYQEALALTIEKLPTTPK